MVDATIKMDGIDGESKVKEHEGEIDVISWSWGMTQAGSFGMGSGGGTAKVAIHDLSFTKRMDKASTALMQKCASGEHIDSALLTARRAGGSQVLYLKIELTDVIVTSVSHGGSQGGDDYPTEQVSLNFAKVKLNYAAQKDDGTAEPESEMKWDLQTNSAD
jgi:type VI secretion system secreted protein Hcp